MLGQTDLSRTNARDRLVDQACLLADLRERADVYKVRRMRPLRADSTRSETDRLITLTRKLERAAKAGAR